jgi:hypothetical protein
MEVRSSPGPPSSDGRAALTDSAPNKEEDAAIVSPRLTFQALLLSLGKACGSSKTPQPQKRTESTKLTKSFAPFVLSAAMYFPPML